MREIKIDRERAEQGSWERETERERERKKERQRERVWERDREGGWDIPMEIEAGERESCIMSVSTNEQLCGPNNPASIQIADPL